MHFVRRPQIVYCLFHVLFYNEVRCITHIVVHNFSFEIHQDVTFGLLFHKLGLKNVVFR